MSTYIKNINCSDEFIDNLIQVIGYPIINKETIFKIFPKEFIINEIIGISLETFYNYFPIIKTFNMPSNSIIESPFDNVLGIIHYNFVTNSKSSFDLNTGNAFYTSTLVTQVINGSNYGTPFNYNGGTYTQYQQKFLTDSMKNLNGGRQYSVRYDENENKFISLSKTQGVMNVTIGCYSNDVEEISKKRKIKFMDLCKSELGIKFAQSIKLVDADLPLEINADDLLEDSKDLKESTIEWLERNSTFGVMK